MPGMRKEVTMQTPEPSSPIEDRVRELESSRRRHLFILILLVFTTCGYETTSTDIGYSGDVERLSSQVRKLRVDVERLSNDLEDTQAELRRVSGRDANT
jgi:hypothetical protein